MLACMGLGLDSGRFGVCGSRVEVRSSHSTQTYDKAAQSLKAAKCPRMPNEEMAPAPRLRLSIIVEATVKDTEQVRVSQLG